MTTATCPHCGRPCEDVSATTKVDGRLIGPRQRWQTCQPCHFHVYDHAGTATDPPHHAEFRFDFAERRRPR